MRPLHPALRAELRKLLTLPSLRITVALTLAAHLLLANLPAVAEPHFYTSAGFLVCGVLATASEHQGGDQIRVTLLAVPRRLRLYATKIVALAAVTAPLASLVALGAGARAAVYLTLTALLGAAAGTLIRGAEAAVVPLLGAYFVVFPLLRGRFPALSAYLPGASALSATAVCTLSAVTLAGYTFLRRDA